MSIQELIEKLKQYPQDLEVRINTYHYGDMEIETVEDIELRSEHNTDYIYLS